MDSGLSAEELRELQHTIDHAELALTTGDAAAALRDADAVLAKLSGDSGTGVRRSALQVRATALEAAGDLAAAIETLHELTSTPTADEEWLRSLIALSRCYRESGDFNRAIAAGEDAAGPIAEFGIDGTTAAIQLTVTVAAAYYDRGDVGQARRLCKRAIETAEKNGSPLGRASAYWNASLIEDLSGHPETALDLARLAMTQFEIGDDSRNLGRLRADIAELQLRIDPPDAPGALRTLEQADRELDWAPTSAADRARQHLTRGEAYFLLGRPDVALEHFELSAERAPADLPTLRASILLAQGRVAASGGRPEDAQRLYQHAAQVLTGVGADRQAAQVWLELAILLEELGEKDQALDAYRRATASAGLRTTGIAIRFAVP
jgi:tetratricopeptide (TPR) repeat protein